MINQRNSVAISVTAFQQGIDKTISHNNMEKCKFTDSMIKWKGLQWYDTGLCPCLIHINIFINDFSQGLQRCADHIKKWYEAGKNSLLNDEIFLAEHNKMNCAEIKPHLKKPEGLEMEDIDL